MSLVLHDLRHALRSLRRAPGLSFVVVATVAAGIAASATVFTLVDALLLKPLPGVAQQARLVNVHATAPDGSSFHSVSFPTWRDLGDGGGAFAGLAAYSTRLASLSDGGEPRLAGIEIVTGNYFQVLGTRPALGRLFGTAEDAVPGRDAVAVLSHAAWTTRFGSDPGLVGRKVLINGHPFTVVGIVEPGFSGTTLGLPYEVWIPTMMASALSIEERLDARDYVWLEMIGRLADGVTLESARERMAVVARRLESEQPLSQKGTGYDLQPATGFDDSLRGAAVGFFGVLSALAGLVLLVAGMNVTGVLLARAFARDREMGIRTALGAGRAGLVRLFVTEILILFAAGGALGAYLATWTAPLLERFQLPTPIPIRFDLSPGPRALAFALLAALALGLLFGLVTALAATRRRDTSLLRAGASTAGRAATRSRSIFVSLQVAASVLLLVTAGLLLRTVQHAAAVDPGFDSRGLYLTSLDLSLLGYDETRATAFFDALLERTADIPGVSAASITGLVPLGPGNRTTRIGVPGAAPDAAISVDFSDVGETHFSTLRIPIVRGRGFARGDNPGTTPVAVVNETLASRLWPGQDPIGRTLVRRDQALTVVGVARDGKYRRPWEESRSYLYAPFRQQPDTSENLVVRFDGTAEALAAALRSELRSLEPSLPLAAVIPVREHIGFSLLPQRVGAAVAAGLGGLGLALAAIGLAGLVAYSVSRRTREIGIRMALGAAPAAVLRLEMRRGARVAAAGLVLGTLAAVAATRLLSNLLFGVGAMDPLTFSAVLALLAVITLAASYLPARRAARIDPIAALRSE